MLGPGQFAYQFLRHLVAQGVAHDDGHFLLHGPDALLIEILLTGQVYSAHASGFLNAASPFLIHAVVELAVMQVKTVLGLLDVGEQSARRVHLEILFGGLPVKLVQHVIILLIAHHVFVGRVERERAECQCFLVVLRHGQAIVHGRCRHAASVQLQHQVFYPSDDRLRLGFHLILEQSGHDGLAEAWRHEIVVGVRSVPAYQFIIADGIAQFVHHLQQCVRRLFLTECQFQEAVHLLQGKGVVYAPLLIVIRCHGGKILHDSVVFQHLHHISHFFFRIVIDGCAENVCQLPSQGFDCILAFAQLHEEVRPLLLLRVPSQQDDAQKDSIPFQDALHAHVAADESSDQLVGRDAPVLVIGGEQAQHPFRLQRHDVPFHKAHHRLVRVG